MKQPSKDHPISVSPFAGRVKVTHGGEMLAETVKALALMEAQYPIVFYVPRADVRTELLEPSQTQTKCPYKGTATYFSLKGAGEAGRDIAWSYEKPFDAVSEISGYLAFYQEKASVETAPT